MINYKNELSVEEYQELRKSVGWSTIEQTQAVTGLSNSTYIICAKKDDEVIGMARVVGDGGYIVMIVDVIVKPQYQGMGIGKTMMNKVMEYIHGSIREGQSLFVNLMAAKDKEGFYSKFGFEVRPNEMNGAGMTMRIIK